MYFIQPISSFQVFGISFCVFADYGKGLCLSDHITEMCYYIFHAGESACKAGGGDFYFFDNGFLCITGAGGLKIHCKRESFSTKAWYHRNGAIFRFYLKKGFTNLDF